MAAEQPNLWKNKLNRTGRMLEMQTTPDSSNQRGTRKTWTLKILKDKSIAKDKQWPRRLHKQNLKCISSEYQR
jgi:hypothetical protein